MTPRIAVFTKFTSKSNEFWRTCPATLYAFIALLGSGLALYAIEPIAFFFAFALLTLPLLTFGSRTDQLRILLALFLGVSCFLMTSIRYHFPENHPSTAGMAAVEIHGIKLLKTPFGSVWNYRGVLKEFNHNQRVIAKDIPVQISIPFEKETSRPNAGFLYHFPAKLKTTSSGKQVLNPAKNVTWTKQEQLLSLAEWRYAAKTAVQKHIQESIQNSHVASFLAGIATGEFDDRVLSYELNRFGLQHLMAISGLHFSIIATFLGITLGLFISRKTASIAVIILMSMYFIFLGTSPSVTRAWVAIIMGLISLLIDRRSSGLNALGVGALVVILWDPLAIREIGFQFSFAVTAAILLWFAPCDALLQKVFNKRKLSEVTKMDSWDQHGYCILYFLRQSLALCFAVNVIAFPLTLYHFQVFPVLSLVYNLFFPFLVSVSLMLLALACGFSLVIPCLGSLLHSANESYTQFVLNFAFNLPRVFDVRWKFAGISTGMLIIYMILVFFLGVILREKEELIEA